uniref:Immunoglobulin V-set domain-containing protein n=1 Tax=Equus asinus asinus TaxID=83772 RepID=A0A8C4LTS5_EQUAS
MGTRFLCWVTICLLGAGGVTQSPRHKITGKGQAVALWCDPISGHRALYWYQQTLGQGLGLLISFEDEAVADDSQLPKHRFSAERSKGGDSTLQIKPAELGDSAVYFCASSLATALQNPFLPVHKASWFSSVYSAHGGSKQSPSLIPHDQGKEVGLQR